MTSKSHRLFDRLFLFLFSSSDQRSIVYPRKSFLYNCLHRNWIRAFSFSNLCLSMTYLIRLIAKQTYPNWIQSSSSSPPTLYSLPLNLFEQMNINFSSFQLFLISIHVFEYFLRSYRYSNSYFNYRNFLLTKHTNVAVILTGSLALIFAYNFVFYNTNDTRGKSFLPLITLNMLLLLLINFLILISILLCFLLNFLAKLNRRNVSFNDEQENLRGIIERNTCMKCYSKILENNPTIFQNSKDTFRNYYPYKDEFEEILSATQTVEPKFHCHRCFYLLIVLLFKYNLLTFPQNFLRMYFYAKQFYYSILQDKAVKDIPSSFFENSSWVPLTHLLYLFARLGDSFLLIRLSYIMKKYFPCWCQFNSEYFQEKSISESSIPRTNSNEHPSSNPHRYRLRFQYLPLWSRNRPRLFPEGQQ